LDLGSATAIPSRAGWPVPGALIVDSPGPSDAEDPVRRRTFTRLAGASFVGAVLADNAVGTGPLHEAQSLVTALITPESGPATAQLTEFSALTKAVANAKRPYH